MPFQENTALADPTFSAYGTYLTTFHSDGGQVSAHLFDEDGELVAHVAFTVGLKPEQITDRFVGQLQRYAAEHGYRDEPRLILTDQ